MVRGINFSLDIWKQNLVVKHTSVAFYVVYLDFNTIALLSVCNFSFISENNYSSCSSSKRFTASLMLLLSENYHSHESLFRFRHEEIIIRTISRLYSGWWFSFMKTVLWVQFNLFDFWYHEFSWSSIPAAYMMFLRNISCW